MSSRSAAGRVNRRSSVLRSSRGMAVHLLLIGFTALTAALLRLG
jgi:hypothetical protein